MLLNARLSERSFARWRRVRGPAREVLGGFTRIEAQSEADAGRLRALGARAVTVPGNLKFAAPPLPCDPAELERLSNMLRGRPVWLAASTHPGEETMIAAAHTLMRREVEGLLTIIVPRHPERGDAVAAMLGGLGLKTQLRSRSSSPESETEIYVADTIGELGTFYAIAPVALVSGSLIEHGGQNPIEAVRHGACVLTGPYRHNFRESYKALFRDGGAVEVRSSDDIATHATKLFLDEAAAKRMRTGADRALQSLGGALEKTLNTIQPLLEKKRN
jgi:3-deoxy-D-manno-octulosonic-acid transferase